MKTSCCPRREALSIWCKERRKNWIKLQPYFGVLLNNPVFEYYWNVYCNTPVGKRKDDKYFGEVVPIPSNQRSHWRHKVVDLMFEADQLLRSIRFAKEFFREYIENSDDFVNYYVQSHHNRRANLPDYSYSKGLEAFKFVERLKPHDLNSKEYNKEIDYFENTFEEFRSFLNSQEQLLKLQSVLSDYGQRKLNQQSSRSSMNRASIGCTVAMSAEPSETGCYVTNINDSLPYKQNVKTNEQHVGMVSVNSDDIWSEKVTRAAAKQATLRLGVKERQASRARSQEDEGSEQSRGRDVFVSSTDTDNEPFAFPGPSQSPRPHRTAGPSHSPRPHRTAGPSHSPRPHSTAGPSQSPRPHNTAGPSYALQANQCKNARHVRYEDYSDYDTRPRNQDNTYHPGEMSEFDYYHKVMKPRADALQEPAPGSNPNRYEPMYGPDANYPYKMHNNARDEDEFCRELHDLDRERYRRTGTANAEYGEFSAYDLFNGPAKPRKSLSQTLYHEDKFEVEYTPEMTLDDIRDRMPTLSRDLAEEVYISYLEQEYREKNTRKTPLYSYMRKLVPYIEDTKTKFAYLRHYDAQTEERQFDKASQANRLDERRRISHQKALIHTPRNMPSQE